MEASMETSMAKRCGCQAGTNQPDTMQDASNLQCAWLAQQDFLPATSAIYRVSATAFSSTGRRPTQGSQASLRWGIWDPCTDAWRSEDLNLGQSGR
ncbi:hypothetical protein O181_027487 [Austropuccinia psidii MF-1]|uniref:Uncharacterized protein n=1 Tax=Austropuccinia psidii MF-1 TaxID=1389203 RepID=A0A9Q3CSQ2_9BASI|nr:hypothetical protein [Austropuccinia psidii MF-1]